MVGSCWRCACVWLVDTASPQIAVGHNMIRMYVRHLNLISGGPTGPELHSFISVPDRPSRRELQLFSDHGSTIASHLIFGRLYFHMKKASRSRRHPLGCVADTSSASILPNSKSRKPKSFFFFSLVVKKQWEKNKFKSKICLQKKVQKMLF